MALFDRRLGELKKSPWEIDAIIEVTSAAWVASAPAGEAERILEVLSAAAAALSGSERTRAERWVAILRSEVRRLSRL